MMEAENLGAVLDALASRDLRIVGLEGVDPALLSGTGWERLPKLLQGREMRTQAMVDREVVVPGAAEPEPAGPLPLPLRKNRRSRGQPRC